MYYLYQKGFFKQKKIFKLCPLNFQFKLVLTYLMLGYEDHYQKSLIRALNFDVVGDLLTLLYTSEMTLDTLRIEGKRIRVK